MILVDTNVWSEAFRASPNSNVARWAESNAAGLWLSTVVIGELLSGAALLPDGRRKQALIAGYDELIGQYESRIAPFDLHAARRYADVLAHQVLAGRKPGTADTQIAATALVHGMALATRNVRHFDGLALELIDPWAA